jgi:type II secretory pathway pseudopilin PulG
MKLNLKIFKGENGQSLMEVLVAFAVISMVLIALVSATVTSINSTIYARNQQQATKYSQESMENVRKYYQTVNWTAFDSGCGIGDSVGITNPPPPLNTPTGLVCTDLMDGATKIGRQVTITVSWNDSKGTHDAKITDYFGTKTY